MSDTTQERKSLGEILVERGDVDPEQVNKALEYQRRHAELSRRAMALHTRQRRRKRLLWLLAVLSVYVAGTAAVVHRYRAVEAPRPGRAVIHGDWFYRDGRKYLVKAVGWDPARPGELPWKRTASVNLVDDDFRRIREAGFNTVRTWDAMSWDELVAAERADLTVLQGIWIEPDGDFSDEHFRQRSRQKIRDIVGYSRLSPVVLGYLIMNEPEAEHVMQQGADATADFLRDMAAEVRRLDPAALVTFSNWPGVEFLNVSQLDFVGANLYPFRPSVLLQALGYEGMVQLWKQLQGSKRPLLITEYGISVAPTKPSAEAPGGASEAEQARLMTQMAEQMLAAGAAGGAAFSWIDGWWKGQNRQGDELTQDPDDPEEWFGLVAMESLDDLDGRPRPALLAMREWHEAVLTLPRNGVVESRQVLIEVHTEKHPQLQVAASLNGNPAVMVPTVREGFWHRGWVGLAVDHEGAQLLDIMLYDEGGHLLRRLRRIVYPKGEEPQLELTLQGSGQERTAHIKVTDGRGTAIAGADVRIALAHAQGTHNAVHYLSTDAAGNAKVAIELPSASVAPLVAAALRLGENMPPAAVAGLLVEVP